MASANSSTCSPLARLPEDSRRLVLHRLPVESLVACEAVSKSLQAAVGEDEIWRPRCEEHWPSCNTGATVTSCRACFTSANGWQRLASLPRSIVECTASTSRRSAAGAVISAFDASERIVASATSSGAGGRVRLCGEEGDVGWVAGEHQTVEDLRLLPDSDAALALVSGPSAATCQVVRLAAHAAEPGALGTPLPVPLWNNTAGGAGSSNSFQQLLLSGASHAYLLNTRGADHDQHGYAVGRLDLCTGRVCERRMEYYSWPAQCEVRSACHDGHYAPHELTLAIKYASDSIIAHYDLRAPPAEPCSVRATGHANVRRVRQGSAGTRTVLTSHTRSRAVELWDLRKFACSHEVPRAPRDEAADAFRCAGNAPDMHCAEGLVVAISGGAAGTAYGAKLHVFSATPRRLSVECTLPEIVIDDGYRLGCPVGITRRGRMLTLVADRQRLLRCWVP